MYVCIFDHAGSLLLRGLFLSCSKQGLLLLWSMDCGACRLWQLWLLDSSRAQALQLWPTCLVAPWHVGSSPNKGLNPCLLHWQADSLSLHCQGTPLFHFLTVCSQIFSAFYKLPFLTPCKYLTTPNYPLEYRSNATSYLLPFALS